jgi:hypothetical protein
VVRGVLPLSGLDNSAAFGVLAAETGLQSLNRVSVVSGAHDDGLLDE